MRTVLVTGAAGFIGSHLVEKLTKKNIKVKCLVRQTSNVKWIKDLDVEIIRGDLAVIDSLEDAVKGVDTIFHLAGRTKARTEEAFYTTNSAGTINLLKAVAKNNPGIKRFVYLSSVAAAGPGKKGIPVKESDHNMPISSYGASKLAGEEAVIAFSSQLPVTILRPSVVFGPRDRDGLNVFKIVAKGIRPKIGIGRRYYSMVYVDDLVNVIINSAVKKATTGETIFVSSYPAVEWNEFLKTIQKALGRKVLPVYVPVFIAYIFTLFIEFFYFLRGQETIINRQKIVELKQKYWVCDPDKQKKLLGIKPEFNLEDAVKITSDWYLEEGWL